MAKGRPKQMRRSAVTTYYRSQMTPRLVGLVVALAGCDSVFGLVPDPTAPPADGPAPCEIGTPFPPGQPAMITGAYNVEAARFTQDEKIVYLSLCELGGSKTTCDLYTGQRFDDGTIGSYARIETSDSTTYDAYPTVTTDGKYLVYAGRRSGETRNYVTPSINGFFTQTGNMLLPVAADLSYSNEPYLLADGKTLYFSGTSDLYRSQGDAPSFGDIATRMRLTSVNSSKSDLAPVVTNDDLELFFSSDRDSAGLDIWTATRASAGGDFSQPTRSDVSIPDDGTSDALQRLEWPVWISSDRCTLYYIAKQGRTDSAVATLYVTSRR